MCEINWEYVIALSSIIASIIISISSIVHSRNSAVKDRINNTISSNRVEWMQELKQLYSEYSKLTEFSAIKTFPVDETVFIEELARITSRIKVHLNLNGYLDKEIVEIINKINTSYDKVLTLKKFQKKDEDYLNPDLLWHLQRFHPSIFEKTFSEVANKIKSEPKNATEAFEIINNLKSDKDFEEKHLNNLRKAVHNDILKSLKTIEHGGNLLSLLVQIYLKAEWERIKDESKSGKYEKYNFDKKVDDLKLLVKVELSELKNKLI